MSAYIDHEREDCLDFLQAEYGVTLTNEQIRFAITVWMERGKRERVAAAKAMRLIQQAADRSGEEMLDEHVRCVPGMQT